MIMNVLPFVSIVDVTTVVHFLARLLLRSFESQGSLIAGRLTVGCSFYHIHFKSHIPFQSNQYEAFPGFNRLILSLRDPCPGFSIP